MIATTTRNAEPLRLQTRARGSTKGHGIGAALYRAARLNGWHCGHWHATPEDAVACAVAKGAPMD